MFLPFVNEKEMNFVWDSIANTISDLFSFNFHSSNIEINRNFNTNFYGKVLIDGNGDVYESFNIKKLGNIIHNDNFLQAKINVDDSLWFLTRDNVFPCSNCLYKLFCPPINEINLYIGRNDLCIRK